MQVKCYVGDNFLINRELQPQLSNLTTEMDLMKSDSFDIDEISFLSSISFTGNPKTLVFSTESLESNDTLLSLLDDDIPDATLFIICDRIVKGRKLYNALKKREAIIDFTLTMPLIKSIAQETAEQCGSYISNDNAAFLGHRLGFDYKAVVHGNDISQYVKQLSMLSNPISENDIIAVVPEHKPDDIWVMKSALMAGNAAKVMQMADTICRQKSGNPISILSAMLIDVRQAYKLSFFPDCREKALTAMGVKYPPRNAEKYSAEQLEKAFNALTNGIRSCKSGANPELQLKLTLCECLEAFTFKEEN